MTASEKMSSALGCKQSGRTFFENISLEVKYEAYFKFS